MESSTVEWLDDLDQVRPWLQHLGLVDLDRGHSNLRSIARSGMTIDLFQSLVKQLDQQLADVSDPDRVLNNLERFVLAARSGLALGAMFDRDPTAIPILLKIFSTSQYLSELLIRDTEAYDALRLSEGQLDSRDVLVDELSDSILNASDAAQAMAILRRFKQRETLRIAFGDLVIGQHVEQVTEQISFVADAICNAALVWARRKLEEKWGRALLPDGSDCGFVILALGKLGGNELNYSSDIDLIMVYQTDGQTGKGRSNLEFFERLTRETKDLLTEVTPNLGAAYRVDLRLRPDGSQGRICNSFDKMIQYYDLSGRTWERQAWIKARPSAGDLDLGQRLLDSLESWVYKRFLSRADISGIRSLKRQIERRARVEGEEDTNVKTGRGGIRDIEFSIQFLQLLNGSGIPAVRTGHTISAIRRLGEAGCLSISEVTLLSENYNWLRKLEHRLQIMFDLQTHTLPAAPEELEKLAVRMDFMPQGKKSALERFHEKLEETKSSRAILDHLLHDAFGSDDENVPLIVDVLRQSEPTPEDIEKALEPYPLQDPQQAFKQLLALSREKTIFLSAARCRHFLVGIAPRLLEQVAQTPDPDGTLVMLNSVSDSLGAKGVLWELFNSSQPALELYVRLCASTDYLADILRSNPGMIDELMDSLLYTSLPTIESLRAHLTEMVSGTEDPEPILHSFKNSQHLRVGIRDVLGKDEIRDTHRALSDIAEVCLQQVVRQEYDAFTTKLGFDPSRLPDADDSGLVILAMGKLGGREPNYHSDLDVVYLYQPLDPMKQMFRGGETHQFFFGQLASLITKFISARGPYGRLYEIDSRLRPTGKSGALAVSTDEFHRYFASGQGQLWERLALCKARPIFGNEQLQSRVKELVTGIICQPWQPGMAEEILQMRLAMQEGASPRNLKRGVGGTVDVEFMVEMLLLKNAAEHPGVVVPGTLDAIAKLGEIGAIDGKTAQQMSENYRLLRSVEARLRLMNTTARHDIPETELHREKLAYLLGYQNAAQLDELIKNARQQNREMLLALVAAT